MKKITIIAIMVLLSFTALNAQTDFSEKGATIGLTVLLPEQSEPLPDGAQSYLISKIKQISAKNGLATNENFGRFFISATIIPTTKDIVPGPPQQIAQSLEITFYIADYFDQKIFATTSINAKGVGTNETKAYINAIKNIKAENTTLIKFLSDGKGKIVDYYNTQCDQIIAQANSFAKQRNHEQALNLLAAIPDACPECYNKAMVTSDKIFLEYINFLCDQNFALAQSAWAAQQNSQGAAKAGEFLAKIYPDAKCYDEAQLLYKEIKSKVLDDWKFEMKIYQDGVDLEKQRIRSIREIGVAYGNHQQPVHYNINWLVK